ncbi:MAG: hypothetical protein A2289_16665 [Deltaproteobacteria bacterium RIFOXYA12_FULL_58_15]|nr:MAG: hypothetical protein A2289_16665 [Deltaproteobacteria bacterium RIFOXYA12_FULL_58_15]OGR07576.1 MAG: hypothetical protein A2341_11855 [Deltaproteobacteria bacterium RIFOXYB12_FULL_58_9]
MEANNERKHRRVKTNIAATVRLKDQRSAISVGRITNVSLGGLFIEMAPLPFGTELQLDFSLPERRGNLVCSGYIVWSTKDKPPPPGSSDGCGVRLTDIGINEMRQLAEFIDNST